MLLFLAGDGASCVLELGVQPHRAPIPEQLWLLPSLGSSLLLIVWPTEVPAHHPLELLPINLQRQQL